MSSVGSNEFRAGLKFLEDGAPCVMLSVEFVKPGKGQAFTRVRYRNIQTGRTLEKTYKSNESVDLADVTEHEMQFLFVEQDSYHFMDTNTFDQIQANADVVGEAAQWLKAQDICAVMLWNGLPLSVVPPKHVILRVIHTEPGFRGDTATGAVKPATLETGAEIRVPLFINIDDLLKIDTRTGEYLSRVKAE